VTSHKTKFNHNLSKDLANEE